MTFSILCEQMVCLNAPCGVFLQSKVICIQFFSIYTVLVLRGERMIHLHYVYLKCNGMTVFLLEITNASLSLLTSSLVSSVL